MIGIGVHASTIFVDRQRAVLMSTVTLTSKLTKTHGRKLRGVEQISKSVSRLGS